MVRASVKLAVRNACDGRRALGWFRSHHGQYMPAPLPQAVLTSSCIVYLTAMKCCSSVKLTRYASNCRRLTSTHAS